MGYLHRLTPSSLDQAAGCIRSTDLEDRVDPPTTWAADGSSGHEVATALLAGKPCPPGLEVDIDAVREALGGGTFSAEVGVIWQPSTGSAHILGEGLSRAEAHRLAAERVKTLDGGWMVGLADLVGVVEHEGRRVVVVADMKFGHKRPPVADECRQTKAYAAGFCAALEVEEAVHGCIWMPGGKGGDWKPPMKGHMDGPELMAFGVEAAALLAEVERVQALPPNERPPYRPGERTCDYCKQATSCPAITGQLERFTALERVDGRPVISRENAREVLLRVREVEKLCKQAKEALSALAEQEPIDMGNGKVWGRHEVDRKSITTDDLAEVLREMGLDHEASQRVWDAAVEVHAGALEKAVVAELKTPKGKGAAVGRLLEAKLQEHGCVKVEKGMKLEEYRPKTTEEA